MRVLLFTLIFVCLTVSSALAGAPKVALTTSEGVIVLELDPQKAPVTVENFLTYVREADYYDAEAKADRKIDAVRKDLGI